MRDAKRSTCRRSRCSLLRRQAHLSARHRVALSHVGRACARVFAVRIANENVEAEGDERVAQSQRPSNGFRQYCTRNARRRRRTGGRIALSALPNDSLPRPVGDHARPVKVRLRVMRLSACGWQRILTHPTHPLRKTRKRENGLASWMASPLRDSEYVRTCEWIRVCALARTHGRNRRHLAGL